jgi:hypothetical protein
VHGVSWPQVTSWYSPLTFCGAGSLGSPFGASFMLWQAFGEPALGAPALGAPALGEPALGAPPAFDGALPAPPALRLGAPPSGATEARPAPALTSPSLM